MPSEAGASTDHVSKKPRISRGIFDSIVVVKVGPGKKSFNMHKSLLCNVAPYFKAALVGDFVEAKDDVLELPEDDPTTFEHFQLWVYTDQVLEKGQTVKGISFKELIDLYIFGDVRGISELQNAVIDQIIDKQANDRRTPIACIQRVYQCLPQDSPLKRLFVDWAAHCGTLDSWFPEEVQHCYCPQYLMALVVALYHIKSKTKPLIKDFTSVRTDYYVKSAGSNPAP